ncbi:dienelactone hydrolase-like enzyme [Mycolicibacterium chubuense NBB4]|uniref:Dienelactone hydrolase-like enzyme n=2 Tax=Mycolicibacterium chubuense TaxID=1800 RepID=I4BNG6_MYCCN|nr:dienelactone hydrolase-like enzyme [Mycolicibacterium chubuense NBB4]
MDQSRPTPVDVDVATPTGPIRAALAVPAGAGPWPGVVVVHDAFGLSDDIRRNTRRFADNGYLAIAPDLFSRGYVRCVRSVMRSMAQRSGQAVDDLTAARSVLADRSDCTGKVGIAGFCMGGGFALVMGTMGFDASAPFYPSLMRDYGFLCDGSCPVVASYGRKDPLNLGNGPRLRKSLDDNGTPNDVKVYPGAGHSFANEHSGQPVLRIAGFGYDADATDDAYRRVFDFFGTHLVAGR